MSGQDENELTQKRNITRRVIAELVQKLDKAVVIEQPLPDPLENVADFNLPAGLVFLEQLASANPTPAGGSAAAYTGACAASLVMMVSRITENNPKYDSVAARMHEIFNCSENIMHGLLQAVIDDSLAYNRFLYSQKLYKMTQEKSETLKKTLANTRAEIVHVPLLVAEKCMDLYCLSLDCLENASKSMVCDSYTASLLAESAFKSSLSNVLFNLRDTTDDEIDSGIQKKLNLLIEDYQKLNPRIKQAYTNQTGIKPV